MKHQLHPLLQERREQVPDRVDELESLGPQKVRLFAQLLVRVPKEPTNDPNNIVDY